MIEKLEVRQLLATFANGIDSTNSGSGGWAWDLKNAMSNQSLVAGNYWTQTDPNTGQSPNYTGFFQHLKNDEHYQYVITKAADGNNMFTNAGGVQNYTTTVLNAAHTAGLKIFPYFYIYGGSTSHKSGVTTSVSGEISIFNSTMDTIGGDGVVFDIEGEYRYAIPLAGGSPNPHQAIKDYLNGIGKSQSGNGSGSRDSLFMAYSSFPYANSHSEVPYVELGDWCDATMPQAYWSSWNTEPVTTYIRPSNVGQTMTPTMMVDDVNSEYSQIAFDNRHTVFYQHPASIKPIILTGMTYDSTNTTTAAEITEFINAAKNSTQVPTTGPSGSNTFLPYGYRGINWFDENSTNLSERNAIAAANVGVLPGMPSNPSPANGATPSSVSTLDWADVTSTNTTGAATSYDVYLDSTLKGNTTASSWTVSPALTSGNHSWYVVAKNMIGNTTLSPAWTFSIPTPPPGTPSNPTPADGAVLNQSFTKLDWDDTPGATSYVVYLGTTGASVNTSTSQLNVSPSDGVALWRVKAVNSGGETLGPQWQYTLDRVAPSATLSPPTASGGTSFLDFSITYTDSVTGVDPSTFDQDDLTITGPNGYSYPGNPYTWTPINNNTGFTTTYRIPAPGGNWDMADNGTYTVSINSSQVSDNGGNYIAAKTVGTFDVSIGFAYQVDGTVTADYDGSNQPIALTQSGSDLVAVQNGVTLNFTGVTGATVNTTSGNDVINVSNMTMPLVASGGNGLEGLNVLAGTYLINGDIGAANPSIVIGASGAAEVDFTATQHLAALNLTESAIARLSAGSGCLYLNDLSIGSSAALDLNDNGLVVNNGDFSTIQALVFQGYRQSADSTATGIISSTGQTAAGNPILALVNNALVGSGDFPFGSGQTIAPNAIVGKYTYFGDTNLDGQVTADDYGALDANFGNTAADPGIAWIVGDTNFDATVTADDYGTLDANFGLGVSNPLAPAALKTSHAIDQLN